MHIVADLYGIVNVPAALWIDENDKIVRPADSTPASDMWRSFSGVDSAVHHELLRRWVRHNELTMDADAVRSFQVLPTGEVQQARLHRRIAVSLRESGDESGALEHMDKAEQLAPHDWTIRRGNMPLRRDFRGVYKGQKQNWYLLRMQGQDTDIFLKNTRSLSLMHGVGMITGCLLMR